MAKLTEEMVVARSRQSDLSAVKKLNCWGAELGDVSLLRRMPNVEVLALSVNKISSLADFAHCPRLRELYIRRNEVCDLSEIRHLQRLAGLTQLWLDENPCTMRPDYRMTVLRNLPNLEKLDNVAVQPEELEEAMRKGTPIADPDDEDYQETEYPAYDRSRDSSPDRLEREQGSDCSEGAPDTSYHEPNGYRKSPPELMSPSRNQYSPEPDERYQYQQQGRQQYYEPDYTLSNGDSIRTQPANNQHPAHHRHSADLHQESPRSDSYQSSSGRCPAAPEREEGGWRGSAAGGGAGAEIASAVMGDHRGFTRRRPVTRNSNLLSAVLCLLKELDYPSLEVAEMAVRCRMDELANEQ